MDEKNIFKELNGINIDEQEFDDIDVSMTDLQKVKLKKNLRSKVKNKKFIKTKIGVAATLIFAIGFGYSNPSLAAQIPLVNPIINFFDYYNGYDNYTNIVDKTLTFDGISFTVDSIACCDNDIIIKYTAKSDKKMESVEQVLAPIFKVGGEWLNVGFIGEQKNIDDNTITGTMDLLADDGVTLPDKFELTMSFDKLYGVKADWNYKFNILKSDLSKDTRILKPNQSIKSQQQEITITEVDLTPVNTIVSTVGDDDCSLPSRIIILDDKGNELTGGGGRSINVAGGSKSKFLYSKLDEDAKYLTFIPVAEQGTDSNVSSRYAVPINTKLPMELAEGKNWRASITDVSYSNDNDTVKIQGVLYGNLPNHQTVFLQGDNLKDEIRLTDMIITKLDTDKYEFSQEYTGLKNDKNYKIIVPNLDKEINYEDRVSLKIN